MRLLRAELTKLRRPLTWAIAVVAVVASLAFAWQGTNASTGAHPPLRSHRPPPVQTSPSHQERFATRPSRSKSRSTPTTNTRPRPSHRPATTPGPTTPSQSNNPSPPAKSLWASWPRSEARC